MNWSRLIRFRRRPPAAVWEGIYEHYRDVPVCGDGYASDRLIEETHADTQRAIRESRTNPTTGSVPGGEHVLLSLVAGLCAGHRGRVTIVDFGGGMGIGYVQLRHNLPAPAAVEYQVIELAKTCARARSLFPGDDQIRFQDHLPASFPGLDIIYLNSALQYVEDYRGLLRQLATLGAKYILFARLSAGQVPTYATAQRNLDGLSLPYWILNVQELIDLVASAGYKLTFHSVGEREYDQSNFHSTHRLGRPCNLLFVRT